MKKGKLARYPLFLVLMVSFVFAACTSPAATPTAVPTAAPKPAAPTAAPVAPTTAPAAAPSAAATAAAAPIAAKEGLIKVGVTTPLSGPAAGWGTAHLRATEMMLEDVNSKGGLTLGGTNYKFKVIGYDNKFSPQEIVTTAKRLVEEDKVNIITSLGATEAIAKYLDKAGVFNWQWAWRNGAVTPDYPLQVNGGFSADQYINAMYPAIAKREPQRKKLAIISTNDAQGWYLMPIMENAARSAGMTVVARETYDWNTTDFTPILLRVLSQNPDIIDDGNSAWVSGAVLVKQARELGYKGIFVHFAGAGFGTDLAEKVGWKLVDGDYSHSDYSEPLPEKLQALKAMYIAKYGQPFLLPAVGYSVPAASMIAALKAANSLDNQKILDAIHDPKFTFDTVWGPSVFRGTKSFGIANQEAGPTHLVQAKDGKIVPVEVIPVGNWD